MPRTWWLGRWRSTSTLHHSLGVLEVDHLLECSRNEEVDLRRVEGLADGLCPRKAFDATIFGDIGGECLVSMPSAQDGTTVVHDCA